MQDKKKRDTVSVRCPFFGRMVYPFVLSRSDLE